MGGLEITNGNGETVINNISVENRRSLILVNTLNTTVDYNLFDRDSAAEFGLHNITGDPGFVDEQKGVFWLRTGSAAINRGVLQFGAHRIPEIDFWGRPRGKDNSVDLGCFAFVPELGASDARHEWGDTWAYRFSPNRRDLPNFWRAPK